MENIVISWWKELSIKYPENQVFNIIIYWILSVYCQVKKNGYCPTRIEEWRTYLLELLRNCMDYDVKESAVRMSDRIEWSLLSKDREIEQILKKYEIQVRSYLWKWGGMEEQKDNLILIRVQGLLEEVFDIAAVNTTFMTTPRCIRNIAGNLFEKGTFSSMADICCGKGELGFCVWQKMKNRQNMSYYGVDNELAMCDINKLLTHIYHINDSEVICQDILEHPFTEKDKKFDLVLLDVPRGRNKNIIEMKYGEWLRDIRQSTIFADWIYVIKAIDMINEKGKGFIVVTPGCLARKNEAQIRKRIIDNDWIEAVITLPQNLYPNTRTGSEIIILDKNKAKKRRGKILFIDISKYYCRNNRNYYSITDEGMELVKRIFDEYCKMPEISNIISCSQVDKEIWSLKPMRYIGCQEEQDNGTTLFLKDVAQITRGVQLKKSEEEQLSKNGSALLLNIKDIQDGIICYENANKITPKNATWERKFRIQEDDIIITSKGTNYKLAIVEENPPEAYICGNLTLLRINTNIYHPYVLLEYLTSKKGIRVLDSIQSGTTIRILNNENLEKVNLPSFHYEEMKLIGEHLKSKRKNYLKQIQQVTEQYASERRVLLEMLGINE